ncbi:ABC-type Mn2+/Zn2+ transport system ATPase subunit [Rhodococcus sp. LBL1]|nr:ABC-type Mn2+/Zn2+ transport system ATPase subunit [Rhodococcus sp. LBL1]MDH6684428.1 ABC-type Mn2+/Zn2+ transport system ATPase subunit [Rhodococcus sp. LBL2]
MAAPALQAIDEDGTIWDAPSEERLHDLLTNLSLTCRFVVVRRLDLEPTGQHYMQVYLNDDLSYEVEFREGGTDRHFQALVPHEREVLAVEVVSEVLQAWAFERPGWREALPWAPWSP